MNEYKIGTAHAARIVDAHPKTVRFVVYPDGRESLQGAYQWSQGFDGGIEWRDLPLIKVDAHGRELPHG